MILQKADDITYRDNITMQLRIHRINIRQIESLYLLPFLQQFLIRNIVEIVQCLQNVIFNHINILFLCKDKVYNLNMQINFVD